MSKTLRTLAVCLAVLLLLSGSYALLINLMPPDSGEATSSANSSTGSVESTPVTYIYEHGYGDFVSVEIQSVNVGTYRLYRDGAKYKIDELENIKYYDAMLETCAERFTKFPYVSIANEAPTAEQLKEYGLEEPQAQATTSFKEGSETLYVGKKDSDGYYYVKKEGSETVYLATIGIKSYFIDGYLSFINTTLFSCAEDYRGGVYDIEFNDALAKDPVCIGRTDADSKSAMQISSSYMITSPVIMAVDTEKFDTGLSELCKFTAEKAVAIISDSSQLSEYGLDNPRYTLEFDYQKPLTSEETAEGVTENTNPVNHNRFIFSEPDEEGYVYVKKSGSDVIYSFLKDYYSFFTWTLDNMAGETFLSPMIKYLDSITVTYGNKDYVFELTSGDGSITAVTYMGKQLDASNFKKYYQVILGTSRVDVGQAEEGAAIHMEFRFNYHDDLNKEDDVLSFKEYNERRFAAEVNGVGRFLIAKTRMDKLERDLVNVINNKPITAFMG